jgi:hypothetical protein
MRAESDVFVVRNFGFFALVLQSPLLELDRYQETQSAIPPQFDNQTNVTERFEGTLCGIL